MPDPRLGRWARASVLCCAISVAGCSGTTSTAAQGPAPDGEGVAAPVEAAPLELSDATVAAAWSVQVASEAALQPFVAQPGWVDLVMKRDVPAAVRALHAEGGVAAARGHAEAAALFQQAAATTAASLYVTFHPLGAETDPEGSEQLAAAALGFGTRHRADDGSGWLKGVAPLAPAHPLASSTSPWIAFGQGTDAAPDAATLDAWPASVEDGWPALGDTPDLVLKERSEQALEVELAHFQSLWALARWHEVQAEAVDAAATDWILSAWREGPEALPEGAVPDLERAWLFGGDPTSAADLQWLSRVRTTRAMAPADPASILSLVVWAGWTPESEAGSRGNASAMGRAIDQAADQLQAASVAAAGSELPHHKPFAGVHRAGLRRLAARALEAVGEREVAGLVRLEARELSSGPAGNPIGLLDLVAFDAENENVARAPEILHHLVQRIPALSKARYGLDVLTLRVGRSGVAKPPGL